MSYITSQESFVAAQKIVSIYPDPSYVTFIAKAQKTKTRKGRDYFVLRITIPKETAEQMKANPDDHLLLRAKKAMWYHMMDWNEMTAAWKMLPQQIKTEVVIAGLPNPDKGVIAAPTSSQGFWVSTESATAGIQPAQLVSPPTIPSTGDR